MSSDNFNFVGPFGELWTNLSASEFGDIDGPALYFYLNEWYHREPRHCNGMEEAIALGLAEYAEYGTSIYSVDPHELPLDERLEAEVAALRQRVKYLDSAASQAEQTEDRVDRLERLVWALGEGLETADANAGIDLFRMVNGSRSFNWAEAVESVDARQ